MVYLITNTRNCKGTEPTVDRLEKDDYIKTDNGLFHIPTQKIVEGTEKIPEILGYLQMKKK